jgi:hypothetical protein
MVCDRWIHRRRNHYHFDNRQQSIIRQVHGGLNEELSGGYATAALFLFAI